MGRRVWKERKCGRIKKKRNSIILRHKQNGNTHARFKRHKMGGDCTVWKIWIKKKTPGIVFVCLKEQKKNRIGSWTQKKKFKRCHFLACTHWRQIEQVNNDNSTNNTLGVTTDWHDDWQDKPFSGCDTFFSNFCIYLFFCKNKMSSRAGNFWMKLQQICFVFLKCLFF